MFFDAAAPGTPEYDLAVKTLYGWYDYFIPVIPLGEKIEPLEYAKVSNGSTMGLQMPTILQCETLIYENALSGMPYGWPNTVLAGLYLQCLGTTR